LHRPELRAWVLYDWANSALICTVVTTVFPIYYARVASAGLPDEVADARLTLATTLALAAVAVVSPVLGALADFRAVKKRLLATFAALGIATTGGLYFVQGGDWLLALILYATANFGAAVSFVFYDSLLPHVARDDELDRVSTSGYALGYLGGGLLLALNLAWIERPDLFGLPAGEGLSEAAGTLPTRLAFLSVAVWWAVFSIPLLLRVREPVRRLEPDEAAGANPLRVSVTRLRETFGELKRYRQAFLLLIAFLIYNDGIQTIYRFAVLFGTRKQIDQGVMIGSIVAVQLIGVPAAVGFGQLARRFTAKRMVLAGLVVYAGISALAFWMETELHFVILAVLVGLVQGGCQALSRSLFASMIPKHKSSEFFAFFAMGEKFAGVVGPLFLTFAILATGSLNRAILSIVLFFVVGGLVLMRVARAGGQRAAREADAGVRVA